MALPASGAHLLEGFPALVRLGESSASAALAPIALAELGAVLPDGGLPRGSVVELAVAGGVALATSIALATCRSAQEEAELRGGEAPWCAFVDPSATLHGPGVSGAGVALERLLVVRPPLAALERTAIRLAESQAFAVIVIDTMGVPGGAFGVALGSWPRVVRRLALSAEGSGACVLLVTDGEARRPLPLPVAMRLELARPTADRLTVRVAKERRGRVSGPRTIVWARPRARALGILPERQQASSP
jgi:hypothetical protein